MTTARRAGTFSRARARCACAWPRGLAACTGSPALHYAHQRGGACVRCPCRREARWGEPPRLRLLCRYAHRCTFTGSLGGGAPHGSHRPMQRAPGRLCRCVGHCAAGGRCRGWWARNGSGGCGCAPPLRPPLGRVAGSVPGVACSHVAGPTCGAAHADCCCAVVHVAVCVWSGTAVGAGQARRRGAPDPHVPSVVCVAASNGV